MMDKGFGQVRPLQGGIEAWIAAGHPALPVEGVMKKSDEGYRKE
jgi:hypothetical protein